MIVSKDLCFTYTFEGQQENNSVFALNNVSINIEKGDFVAILGHNGSGKSTLARHLNALLTPTDGTLWIKGMDTRQPEHTWDIRQSTGMVFQNPDNQIIAAVVEEDVAFGPENLGVPPSEIRRRVDETLAAVGMSEYADSVPHHLSGGQKQRVAIAGVLAMQPDCIVLDEPTAMLDPSGRKEVTDTVLRLNRESGITVILITHYMEEAVLANRVLVMDRGVVVLDGPPSHIFQQVEKMRSLGLDVPQVTALAHELRQRGLTVSESIMTLDDFVQDMFIQRMAGKPINATVN